MKLRVLMSILMMASFGCTNTNSPPELSGKSEVHQPLAKRIFYTISGHSYECDEVTPRFGVVVRAEGTYPKKQGRIIVNKVWNTETTTDENGWYSLKCPHHWSGNVFLPDDVTCPGN